MEDSNAKNPMPDRYDSKASEERWLKYWEEQGIYSFDPDSKADIYSIDTPPPTVSGKMHLGHAFSYTQQDIIVRYKRMKGFNIFYPFGTDDNGLATERLIEKMKNVKATRMPRNEFTRLCLDTLNNELRPQYVNDWKKIGMSCDWKIFYTTIDKHCQKISQKAFLDLVKKDRVYRKEAPVMWCPNCQTAISQVECQDANLSSFFNDIVFKVNIDGKEEELIIATTRPELLPACVAVFYHPADKRYKHLKGKKAKVPLFDFEVPIFEDEKADPEKGTGIVMCCTFGDTTDCEWQKAHNLPVKEAISKDGKMTSLSGKYEGHDLKTARKLIIDDLKDARLCISQSPISHAVNVHERCGTEIEFLNSKQWFIRYLDLKETFLERGRELRWYPEHMRNRYENWIKGLQWDWCISRQRFSGVPFPVWYDRKTEKPVFASEDDLPIDPVNDVPKGYKKEDLIPEYDIMDTWATSSLTPHLAADLFKDHQVYKKLLPMSLRPQAHDIITFWLFNTVVRSDMHDNQLPWHDVMISGWALDPHGKKMSKSKGNTIEPQAMIEKYCADALRFWAASSSLGDDLPFMEKELVAGQKTITKLWNATKFSLLHLHDFDHKADFEKEDLEIMDLWLISKLQNIIKVCTEALDRYEYARTKLDVEKFFWQTLCDNYLEICKDRLYNPEKRGAKGRSSAQYAIYHSFLTVLKMFAPIMPYVTEEIYHSYFAAKESSKSIHNSSWPEVEESIIDPSAEAVGDLFVSVLQDVRKAKSEAKKSLKHPVAELIIEAKIPVEKFTLIEPDLKACTQADRIFYKKISASSEADYLCDIKF